MPTQEIHVRIDEDLKQRLLALAKKERRSLSGMIVFAAAVFADQHEAKPAETAQ